MFPSSIYHQQKIKKYQNFLPKNLKSQFIGMNIRKLRGGIQEMNKGIFWNQTVLVSIDYLKLGYFI